MKFEGLVLNVWQIRFANTECLSVIVVQCDQQQEEIIITRLQIDCKMSSISSSSSDIPALMMYLIWFNKLDYILFFSFLFYLASVFVLLSHACLYIYCYFLSRDLEKIIWESNICYFNDNYRNNSGKQLKWPRYHERREELELMNALPSRASGYILQPSIVYIYFLKKVNWYNR